VLVLTVLLLVLLVKFFHLKEAVILAIWIDNYAVQIKHEVKLGESIAKGQAVYVSSASGTNMIVSKASNASEPTSSKTMGLLETGGVT